jgi:hypothetical protein
VRYKILTEHGNPRASGFGPCNGGCGRYIHHLGMPRGTKTYQTKGLCRKCTRQKIFASRVRWEEKRKRKSMEVSKNE